MTTYTDTDFWNGHLWLREPAIDGQTALNECLRRTDDARKNVQAIETALGTVIRGSAANLVTRLSYRLSKSGIGRGQCYPLRPPNTVAGTLIGVKDWFERSPVNYQFGQVSVALGVGTTTVTYPSAYAVAPNIIIAGFVADDTAKRCGQVQIVHDLITTTTFTVVAKAFWAGGTWREPDFAYKVLFVAIGGS